MRNLRNVQLTIHKAQRGPVMSGMLFYMTTLYGQHRLTTV